MIFSNRPWTPPAIKRLSHLCGVLSVLPWKGECHERRMVGPWLLDTGSVTSELSMAPFLLTRPYLQTNTSACGSLYYWSWKCGCTVLYCCSPGTARYTIYIKVHLQYTDLSTKLFVRNDMQRSWTFHMDGRKVAVGPM